MDGVETAILRTILYADIFNFPLTTREIHHFLIHDEPVSREGVEQVLLHSRLLADYLVSDQTYFARAGRDDIIELRHQREQLAGAMWITAAECAVWLARLPFVRMVALTGALAMRNPRDRTDDYDFLIVTAPGRVWLARAFSVLLVRLMQRLNGTVICPNYVLAESALAQQRHDLFVAHEVVQAIPLFGSQHYHSFRDCNRWVFEHLPNAGLPIHTREECRIGRGWSIAKRVVEWLLGGRVGDWLENWEYRRKLSRFATDLQTPHHTAQIDPQQVKGHFNSYAHPVLQKYYARLRDYALVEQAHEYAGD